MKKVVRSIAIVALMFVTSTGLAKEPELSIVPNANKSISFQMESEDGQIFVKITDSNEQIVFSDKIEESVIYSKKFDLSNLPEGNYFLKIEDSLKVTVYELFINNSDVAIGEIKENAKPVFRSKDGLLFLNLLNMNKDVVKIKVVDAEGRIVFQEKIVDEMLIEKVFNFQSAFENTYTVVVEDKNDIYYENIIVK